nr:PREDICTED: uncharacterized protein LOC109030875 isoform X1 [Bemisia tabaci]
MDSSEYEMVRNMTLLFFFERLLDKGGPRTLHDLSCQFGAKGFTKEMRQIAGGSQSGLKKFLSQYPSLFKVDGEFVYDSLAVSAANDAEEQAPTYVKYSPRDYAQEAVEYFRNKLLQYGVGTEVPIISLYGHRSQASPEVRHISGTRDKEFIEFLARYPETFVINDGTVTLTEHIGKEKQVFHEIEEVHIDPRITFKLIQFFKQCIESKGPSLIDTLFHSVTLQYSPEVWSCVFQTPQDLMTFFRIHSNIFSVQSNLITLVNPLKNEKNDSTARNQNHSPLPKKETVINNVNSPGNFIPLVPPETAEQTPPIVPKQNQTLKQRINSLVLKTLADNTVKDRNFINASANNNSSNHSTEEKKFKILQSTKVIANHKECAQILSDITASSNPVVAFDCEGVNLGVKGTLSLLQVSLSNGQAYIFDLITCPQIITQGGFQAFLESESVVKVMHDCRNDSANLHYQFGITLRNVFDTQAAHAVLQLQHTGKPVYKVKNVSLNKLCELYQVPQNFLKEQLKAVYRRDQRYWARRPLSRDMILYAATDVLVLVPQLYDILLKQITPDMVPLLKELCDEQVFMNIQPNDVKLRKRQRKVESEVSDLRSKLAQSAQTGRNIVLSNREIRLLRYLELTDEEKEKLKGSYKVARKLEKLQGKGKDGEEGESGEFQSLDSYNSEKSSPSDSSLNEALSPNSEPLSLTESMQLMDNILSDKEMDRLDKMERLEELLTAATMSASAPVSNSSKSKLIETGSQTLSTGDIVITKVYCDDDTSQLTLTKK